MGNAGAGDVGGSVGAVAADYDNDGDTDLYVVNFNEPNVLYRNQKTETGSLSFVDVTSQTDPTPALSDDQHGVGVASWEGVTLDDSLTASWFDANLDGHLDLYVGNHNSYQTGPTPEGPFAVPGRRDVFYMSNGDGTFNDVTMTYGVTGFETITGSSTTPYQRFSSTNAVMTADFNNDQWPDLFVSNKLNGPTDRDMLYINNGVDAAGTWLGFDNVSYDLTPTFGVDAPAAMGIDVIDYDHDGDPDVYLTDTDVVAGGTMNDLLINQITETGQLRFVRSGAAEAAFSWGAVWQDFDNNGWEDLHVSTHPGRRDYLYMNFAGSLIETAQDAGVDQALNSRGNPSADYDHDGYPDLFVTNMSGAQSVLFHNVTGGYTPNHYLTLRLIGEPTLPGDMTSSRDAIGARVTLTADLDGSTTIDSGEMLIREVASGSGNAASTSSLALEAGLGLAAAADIAVTWPSARKLLIPGVASDQLLEVRESDTLATTVSPIGGSSAAGTVDIVIAAADIAHPTAGLNVEVAIAAGPYVTAPYDLASGDFIFEWITTSYPEGPVTILARVTNASGVQAYAAPIEVEVDNDASPSAAITQPTGGAHVGTVVVSVDATDTEDADGSLTVDVSTDGGTTWAQALLVGGTTYEMSWNTAAGPDGAATLLARAKDSADQTTTSSAVQVEVDNIDDPPAVAIQQPLPGQIIAGTINVIVAATDQEDADGSLNVEVSTNGTTWLPAVYSGSGTAYLFSWNTIGFDGPATVQARATDALAGTGVASPVAVTVANTPYEDLVMANNPDVYYRLGDVSGTTAVDSSGHNVHAIYAGAPALAQPPLIIGSTDGSVDFDGANDVVQLSDSGYINLGSARTERTIEVWFHAADTALRQVIYEQGGLGKGASIYVEAGRVYFGMWNTTNNDPTTPWGPHFLSAPIEPDTTYHGVLVLDQPEGRLEAYIDGLSIGAVIGPVGKLHSHSNDNAIGAMRQYTVTHLGSQGTNGLHFEGLIDEVALYPTALADADILAHYTIGSGFGGNYQPQAVIVAPGDGSILSGASEVIAVAASDTEDGPAALTVEVSLNGGGFTPAAYNAVTGNHELGWDTNTTADGDVTIDARVTDTGGLVANAPAVTVTVNNVDDPPTVTIVNPSEAATVNNTVQIRVDAIDLETTDGTMLVEVSTDGGFVWTAAPSIGGTLYGVDWDTTGGDGPASIEARATDGTAQQASAVAVAVTVDNTTVAPLLVAAGDIADSSTINDEATAVLLDAIFASSPPGVIAPLGDLVYNNATLSDFNTKYDPTWGRHNAIVRPATGNHEYVTANAAGYFSYFAAEGVDVGSPTEGWYSYVLGDWKIFALNSNCAKIGGCDIGSAQNDWLRAELIASTEQCIAAYWHHPLLISTATTYAQVKPLYQALYEYQADLVLVGHVHYYERFSLATPDGLPDPLGLRQFTVGTGGKYLHNLHQSQLPISEFRTNDYFGVLKLQLADTGYSWEFIAIDGGSVIDSGSDTCH